MEEAVKLSELRRQVVDLTAQLEGLTSEVTDLAAAVTAGSELGSAATPEPIYSSFEDWVGGYFTPMFTRPVGGDIRWCAAWREHAEAITRLEALWRSWEVLRLDAGTGMATWLTNYLDPQLHALLSRAGTFAQCQPDRHAEQRPLPAGSTVD